VLRWGVVAATAALAVTACTSTSSTPDEGASASGAAVQSSAVAAPSEGVGAAPEVNRAIRIGVQAIGTSRIVAELYARALKDAGFDVELTVPGTVDTFVEAMAKGQVDVLPVYATRFADYLYTSRLNLDGSRPVTNDLVATVAAGNTYGEERGIRVLAASQAEDRPTFAVTKEFAEATGISTLSGLAVWSRTNELRLGGNPTCEVLSFCKPNLERTYSMRFKEFVPLTADGTVVKGALDNGSIELGYFFGTDSTLSSPDLVVLEEDIPLNVFNNATPAVREAFATPEVVGALERVSEALTQEDFDDLVNRVDVRGEDVGRVAADWLAQKGIGEGLYDGPVPVADVVIPRTVDTSAPTETPTPFPDGGPIRISHAPLFDTEVAARIYAGALVGAGYKVDVGDAIDPAEILAKMPTGEVQLAPMRLNVISNILKVDEYGALTLPIMTRDANRLVSDARDLALPRGLAILSPSNANAGSAFVVNDAYAALSGVDSLSELARASEAVPVTLGGPPNCPTEFWCQPYLEDVYGISIKEFVPLDAGGPLSRAAVDGDSIDLVWLSGNDGGIEEFGFTVLEDDLSREPINPIAPVMQQSAVDPGITKVVDLVSAKLTTEAVRDMNHRVEFNREEMNDVVQEFLRENGLKDIDLAALADQS
jgi:osmoprotectant transport system substrate-binding protein